jgi:hypothetical protein
MLATDVSMPTFYHNPNTTQPYPKAPLVVFTYVSGINPGNATHENLYQLVQERIPYDMTLSSDTHAQLTTGSRLALYLTNNAANSIVLESLITHKDDDEIHPWSLNLIDRTDGDTLFNPTWIPTLSLIGNISRPFCGNKPGARAKEAGILRAALL